MTPLCLEHCINALNYWSIADSLPRNTIQQRNSLILLQPQLALAPLLRDSWKAGISSCYSHFLIFRITIRCPCKRCSWYQLHVYQPSSRLLRRPRLALRINRSNVLNFAPTPQRERKRERERYSFSCYLVFCSKHI